MRYSSSKPWHCVYRVKTGKWIAGCEDNFLTALILAIAATSVLSTSILVRRETAEHVFCHPSRPLYSTDVLNSWFCLCPPSLCCWVLLTPWELAWYEPHWWVWLVHIQMLQMCLSLYLLARCLRRVPTTEKKRASAFIWVMDAIYNLDLSVYSAVHHKDPFGSIQSISFHLSVVWFAVNTAVLCFLHTCLED